jgi:hypothetical protein
MTELRRPPIAVDLRPYFAGEERGHHDKSLVVWHETVSHNKPGLSDITAPAAFLDATGLEIHGMIDIEGQSAWAYDPTAIYDHAASGSGGVNTRSIGFELVSEVPLEHDAARRRRMWDPKGVRRLQLERCAQWAAWLKQELGIPLRWSDGSRAGHTSHWNVSQTYLGGDGHWDCWPVHLGGHWPALYVMQRARNLLRALGDV